MRPADMLMKVGASHYPSVGDFVREVMHMGASKRLPSVPTGAVQDVTRIFLVHPRAIVTAKKGMDMEELMYDLTDLAVDNDTVRHALRPTPWHDDVSLIARVYATKDPQARALLKKYGVRFWPGIFGYYYLAQLQGIVGNEEGELDAALTEAGVVPVFVVKEKGGVGE